MNGDSDAAISVPHFVEHAEEPLPALGLAPKFPVRPSHVIRRRTRLNVPRWQAYILFLPSSIPETASVQSQQVRMQTDISWEGSKENIQPLKAGRKPDALKKALGESTGTIKLTELEAEKLYVCGEWLPSRFAPLRSSFALYRKIETEIASYKGSDPLEPYLKYVKL
jgi:hypothetical protein